MSQSASLREHTVPFAKGWRNLLPISVLIGVVVVGAHGMQSGSSGSPYAGLALAGACLSAGTLFGFLFGIPRSLQSESGQVVQDNPARPIDGANSDGPKYRANTNLEQISDWLTKILVGVGLTQLNNVPSLFQRGGELLGPSLAPGSTGTVLVGSIVVYFSIIGFLGGYLWTRLFLGSALVRADLETLNQRFDRIERAQRDQEETDAKALSLVNRFLSGDKHSDIDIGALKDTIKAASAPIKVQVFYQAREARRKKASNDPSIVARTIPIFEALAESDADRVYHKNLGQLGYALMDQRWPDYKAAIEAFTAAIKIRGDAREYGFVIYEYCRAVCRIKSDTSYESGTASSDELRKLVLDDLKIAKSIEPDFDNETLEKWTTLNPSP